MWSIFGTKNNIAKTHPFPALRNLKRHFILCDIGQRFFFFDFAFLDESLLLGLNLPVQFLAGAFFGALLDELALYRHLQERLLHIRRKPSVKFFQTAPCLLVAVDQRQQLFDFPDDSLLFRISLITCLRSAILCDF